MHPDISQFPREVFYDKEALQDLPGIAQSRQLNYHYYKHLSLWIDVRDQNLKARFKNSNETEAKTIITELQDLMEWTKTHPKPITRYWEIAILPFYKGQERLIRKKLQKLFRTTRKRTFKDLKANMDSSEYGGAIFLGLNGISMKAHGNSDSKAIKNAIKAANKFAEKDFIKYVL